MRSMSEAERELDRLWALERGQPAETDLVGFRLSLADGPSFVSQYREIFIAEAYDFPFEGDSPVIIDGGANIGLASIWWLARWPLARIVALEPDPNVFQALASNLRHHSSERVEIRRAALSTPQLGGSFLAEGTDAGRLVRGGAQADLVVPTQSLAELLRNLGAVDLLKLDIEGAELDVLEEAQGELSRVARVFVEWHSFVGQVQRFPELVGLLRNAGFRVYFETPVKSVRPFKQVFVDREVDLQVNLWAWR